ncbi:MAG: hypothetical protein Kow0059_08510 [Candidatus Sumerlaeia bacterium]
MSAEPLPGRRKRFCVLSDRPSAGGGLLIFVLLILVTIVSGCRKQQADRRAEGVRASMTPAVASDPSGDGVAAPKQSVTNPDAATASEVEMTSSFPTPEPPREPARQGLILGRVLDDLTSSPLSGVLVTLSDKPTTSRTALDGRFRFTRLPLGNYTLQAVNDGYSTGVLILTLSESATSRTVDLRLQPLAGVAGRVTDESGAPAGGVKVYIAYTFHLNRQETRQNGPEDTTSADGRFEITNVAPGRTFNVVASHEGYPPVYAGLFKLEPGQREGGIALTLKRGGVIRGVVRTESGAPVSGAEVRAGDADISMIGNSNMMKILIALQQGVKAISNDEGRFELSKLAAGNYILLASHAGHQTGLIERVPLAAGQIVEDVALILKPGAVFSGIVQNGAGQPVAGAEMIVQFIDPANPVLATQHTGRDGRFHFDTLRSGQYFVMIKAPNHPDYQKINQPVPQQDVVIVLPEGGRLTGRVTKADSGRPVTRFTVRVKEASLLPLPVGAGMGQPTIPKTESIENADGFYEIRGLKPGLYSVTITAPGYAPDVKMGVKIEEGRETVHDAALSEGLRLAGRVVDAVTRAPIAGAAVRRTDTGEESGMFDILGIEELSAFNTLDLVTTDADGRFVFAHLNPGPVKLQASDSAHVPQSIKTSVEQDGVNEVEIVMERGAVLRGRVVEAASRQPVANAKVAVAGSGMFARMFSEFQAGEFTGTDGRFTLRRIPEGKVGLVVVAHGYPTLTTDKWILYNNQEYDAGDLALTGGGRIEGAATKGKRPLAGATVTVLGPSGFKMTSTDDAGRYSLAPLEGGTYQVTLINNPGGGLMMSGRMQTLQKTASVKDGETTELNFEFPGGLNLTGVLLRRGEPSGGWLVGCSSPAAAAGGGQAGGGIMTAGEDGRFSFSGLEPGEYVLTVSRAPATPNSIPSPVLTRSITLTDTDVALELVIPEAALGGVVVDAETQKPVSNAVVQLIEEGTPFSVEELTNGNMVGFRNAATGADGMFVLDKLEAKTWVVTASHPDYSVTQQIVPLREGERIADLRLELRRGETIRGRAYDYHSGVRVPQLTILIHTPSGQLLSAQSLATDAQGNFILSGMKKGEFRLEAWAANYAPILNYPLVVMGGETGDVVLQFHDGAALALTVTQPGGAPIGRARADIVLEGTGEPLNYPPILEQILDWQERTFTNEQGRLFHPNLPAGAHLLRITHKDYRTYEAPLDLFDGQRTELAITLRPK